MGCPLYWQIINPVKNSKIALKGLSERWSDPQYLFTDKEGRCFTVPILFPRWKLILTIRVLSRLKKSSLHCLQSWCKSIWNSIVTFVLCYWNVMKQERISRSSFFIPLYVLIYNQKSNHLFNYFHLNV